MSVEKHGKKKRLTKTTLVYLGQGLNPDKPFKATIPFNSPTPPSPIPPPQEYKIIKAVVVR